MQAVQDSIEQYVAFTDKKFASENDFVRYQLAGELLFEIYHQSQRDFSMKVRD